MKMQSHSSVRLFEVGLRDGLQNESIAVSVKDRLSLLQKLVKAGLHAFEVGSFVSPKWVPAMAVSEELFSLALKNQAHGLLPEDLILSALVPNIQGMNASLRLGLKEIAVFAACSETFSQKNTNCTIEESFLRLSEVVRLAIKEGIRVRGYLSTCFGCPFEGPIDLRKVSENVGRMFDLGVYEVSLGDTIGLAAAGDVEKLLNLLLQRFPANQLAGHFHDTRGQAVANVLKAYEMGLRVFDASLGGLGGCPYAPGATGNVATEDLVFLFSSMGIDTGIHLEELLLVNQWFSSILGKPLPSKLALVDSKLMHHKDRRVCFL